MNSKHTHHLDPSNLQFSVFSTEDIKKMSVAKVITPTTFDALGHPIPGGLYDPAMGKFNSQNLKKKFLLNFILLYFRTLW